MRILVIDDRPDMLATVARMLASDGHDTVMVSKPAAQLSEMQPQDFDAVLTDIFMPDIDGLEIIKTVRKAKPNLWIVAMSGGCEGSAASDVLRWSTMLGADRVLYKPFRKAELLEALEPCRTAGPPAPVQ